MQLFEGRNELGIDSLEHTRTYIHGTNKICCLLNRLVKQEHCAVVF